MTNELKVIHEQEVLGQGFRIYGSKEEPLFLAKDVAEWIENKNVSQMLNVVEKEEKGLYNVYTLGGTQKLWFLTEDGLYEVLMQSRKPIAKQFSRLNFQQLIFR
ncbi:Bro-N domain-containing protein [Bacillus mobilis]|uniref:BRO-N domain-containing protein n=1 Tax=Bacillus mobilis TaxID=2026190 RepID=UPI002FDC700E